MITIMQTVYLNAFSWKKSFWILIQISLLVSIGSVDKSLVQLMAWYWTGDKPLPETILTQVHQPIIASLGLSE